MKKGQEVRVEIDVNFQGKQVVNGLIMFVSKSLVEVNTCYGTVLVEHSKVEVK